MFLFFLALVIGYGVVYLLFLRKKIDSCSLYDMFYIVLCSDKRSPCIV
jgi:hypothetical protein